MPIDVTMPKLTDSMEEGRIVAWNIAIGDTVAEGDVLAEIETDKAVMELESFWAGSVLELLHGDGDVVAVGAALARLAEASSVVAPRASAESSPGEPVSAAEQMPAEAALEDSPVAPSVALPAEELPGPSAAPSPPPQAVPPAVTGQAPEVTAAIPIPGGHPLSERGGVESPRPAPPQPRTPAATSPPLGDHRVDGVRASPRARRRALELGVPLAGVSPTGGDGQVTVEDVEAAAGAGRVDLSASPAPSQAATPPDRADEELPPVLFSPEEAEVEAVSFYQKAVIRRVVASKHVIPHFYVTKAVRAGALLARQKAAKEATGATLTHFIMRACALALAAYPEANRSYDRGRWIRWKVVHLGLAVQTDAGLVVAVLREAQQRDLASVAEHTRALVDRARAGKLSAPERSNPTFTISNLGGYDVESFAAIINPPSALTLAVGSVVDVPVVEGGQVVPGRVLHLTLSCDHRVVDGVLAAQFLGEVKRLLENPGEL